MSFHHQVVSRQAPEPQDFCLIFYKDQIVLTLPDAGFALPLWSDIKQIPFARVLALGTWHDMPCWACEAPAEWESVPAPWTGMPLRPWIAGLSGQEFQITSMARHLLWWQSAHQFCGRCGKLMADSSTERARICSACNNTIYPVIAPAIIVAVKKGDSILLARNANFPGNRHSVIAGFVDAGETLEQAVVREIREEVGVEVKNIRYVESQPWPFPNSLMLGFQAEWASGEIQVDGKEITFADWFTKEELPEIPPPGSIAHRLIEMS